MEYKINSIKSKTAIVILAYADYESLELSLATHAKFSINSGVHIYILQNGRGTYDCERTYSVAKRYHDLFPRIIDVIDYIPQNIPFYSLQNLFSSELFNKYEYIIKLDDDVMVLTNDWIEKLCKCYIDSNDRYGNNLAYVTSLVNNNPYGFKKIIESSQELKKEYFAHIAREHLVGCSAEDSYAPYRIYQKDIIASGANGTIWRYAYIAKFLHEKTTMEPDTFINISKGLGYDEVNNKERYSINCIFFKKKFWNEIYDGGSDDEHMIHKYCLKYNKKIISDLSIPMVHIAFFYQRNEIRNIIDAIRSIYTSYLNLNFPISMCQSRLIEIENRIRFIENKIESSITNNSSSSITNNSSYLKKYIDIIFPKGTAWRNFVKKIVYKFPRLGMSLLYKYR